MKSIRLVLLITLLFTLMISGCYTKFYRPGMERQAFSTDRIYNPNDSTAIDTTLTPDNSTDQTYYPNNDDRWYYWGRPRGINRWGFDFDNFSPGYYWTYQGYYDYYGTPWWSNSYGNSWWNPYYNNGGGSGGPSEPPSRREGDRGRISDGGGSYAQPGGGGSYATPAPAPAPEPSKDNNATKNQDTSKPDPNKRTGGRGR